MTKTGEEADRLFAETGEKYAAAVAVKPDKHEPLYDRGYALIVYAKTKTGEEAARLLAQAKEEFDRVEEMSPGGSAYNQACVAALLKNEVACRNWLERSKDSGTLPDREQLLTDGDLESVRECPWFTDFVRHAYPAGTETDSG